MFNSLRNLALAAALIGAPLMSTQACGGRNDLGVPLASTGGPGSGGFGVSSSGDAGGFGASSSGDVGGFGAGSTSTSNGSGGFGAGTASSSGGPGGFGTTTTTTSSGSGAGTASSSGGPGGFGGFGTSSSGVGGAGAGTTSSSSSSGAGGSGPVECLSCVFNECPEALSCLQNPDCINGVVCAVSQCLQSGNPDLFCVIGCFNGDIGAALGAFQAVTCVATTCGVECAGGLGF